MRANYSKKKLSRHARALLDSLLELYCEDRLVRKELIQRIEEIATADLLLT